MAFRAFVAVEVPPAPEVVHLLRELDALDAGVRTVAPANIHLTLAFLGDVDEARVGDVTDAVDAAVAERAAFSLDLTGVGAFPPRGAPRVVWLGVGADAARALLEDLAEAVRRELTDRDVDFDHKAFRAHVTVGRVKRPRGVERLRAFIDDHAAWRGGRVDVARVEVKRSTLTPQGPVYETVHAAPLEDDPA